MAEKKSIFTEFKEFISRGNVMDMAVGVIIGGAFTKIVNSLVSDVITPALGMVTGGVEFSDMKVVLEAEVPEVLNEAGEVVTAAVPEVAIRYGVFLDAIINFLLIAVCVFLMVKVINTIKNKAEALKKKEEEKVAEEAPAPAPDPQLELLTEIRDLLKK